jgi:hypothetical protein
LTRGLIKSTHISPAPSAFRTAVRRWSRPPAAPSCSAQRWNLHHFSDLFKVAAIDGPIETDVGCSRRAGGRTPL